MQPGLGGGLFTIIMVVASLAFTAVVTGGSLFIAWRVFKGFSQSMQQSAQLLATGLPGQARVLGVRDLGGSIQMGGQLPQQRLQIDLEVTPLNGQPGFRTSITQLVSMLHLARLAPGAMVEVRYDPANPARAAVVL